MRLEGQDGRGAIQTFSSVGQARDKRGMAEVHAIEVTDGDNDRRRNGARMTAENAH